MARFATLLFALVSTSPAALVDRAVIPGVPGPSVPLFTVFTNVNYGGQQVTFVDQKTHGVHRGHGGVYQLRVEHQAQPGGHCVQFVETFIRFRGADPGNSQKDCAGTGGVVVAGDIPSLFTFGFQRTLLPYFIDLPMSFGVESSFFSLIYLHVAHIPKAARWSVASPSFRLQSRTTLILGSGPLAASRAFAALEADSAVTVIAKGGPSHLRARNSNGARGKTAYRARLGCPASVERSFVCITDTVLGTPERRSRASAERIYRLCRARNIPVNTTDAPDLCDFSFAAAHRFEDAVVGGADGPTGRGMWGAAVDRVGTMRSLARTDALEEEEEGWESEGQRGGHAESACPPTQSHGGLRQSTRAGGFERIVRPSLLLPSTARRAPERPHTARGLWAGPPVPAHARDTHSPHPSSPTLVLSDKLVPAAVLAIIPQTVQVRIAKKFPGNAEGAQNEMMEAAVEAAQRGLTVIRLKQGDPVVYGRAGEEVLYFRAHGFEPGRRPRRQRRPRRPHLRGHSRHAARRRRDLFGVHRCRGDGKGKDVQLPGSSPRCWTPRRRGAARGRLYPPHLPIAMWSGRRCGQRVLVSTLRDVVTALESLGSSGRRGYGDWVGGACAVGDGGMSRFWRTEWRMTMRAEWGGGWGWMVWAGG
ncbi:hypothetical protein B0H14DRAFT_3163922 [Mycena olivaceomarginata]|nr:hypothetical protein B0H14DRAFT_3163922 [Mycena olivaceomarginata]